MKTKSHLIAFCSIALLGLNASAFAQTAQWIEQTGTGGISNGVSSDAAGSCYATGMVNNPALFDDLTIPAHAADVFLSKYDNDGHLLWATVAGGDLIDQGYDIATDASGNSFVVGEIQTNSLHPTATFGNITLTGHGDYDWFVAKYDVNGNVVWAKNGGSTGGDFARSAALDPSGNLYVCGLFSNSMTVDGVTVTSAGLFDVFLAKFDTNGALLWLRRAGGTGSDLAYGIARDAAGNFGVVGEFQKKAFFDSHSVVAAGLSDAFIAKYDAAGNNLWVHRGGSNVSFAPDRANAISADASDNFYVTGEYSGNATFDGLTVDNTGTSGSDIFIAKYNSAGVIQWLHHGGGLESRQGLRHRQRCSRQQLCHRLRVEWPGRNFRHDRAAAVRQRIYLPRQIRCRWRRAICEAIRRGHRPGYSPARRWLPLLQRRRLERQRPRVRRYQSALRRSRRVHRQILRSGDGLQSA